MQDCSNSIANSLELMQSCAKPSIYASLGLDEIQWLFCLIQPSFCFLIHGRRDFVTTQVIYPNYLGALFDHWPSGLVVNSLCSAFLSSTLSKGKKGDYGIVSTRSFVCLSICSSGQNGHLNSTIIGPIHSKSSSLEPWNCLGL